jgi:chemotaxis family two-component system response regulator Rcp1
MSRHTVGRPMEILLVEDSLTDACLTIAALKNGQVQHRLTLILDGEEAMEFLNQEGKFARAPRPDLILLDLVLPKKSGIELLTEIRADYGLNDIPVVVLTGLTSGEDRLRCETLQVDAYITKPVNLDKFLAVVKELKRFWLEDVILPSID